MPNKNKPEHKPIVQNTGRDFEQEYLDANLKLNKRALRKNSQPNKHEQDLANKKHSEEN
jgi:hypothetical protein